MNHSKTWVSAALFVAAVAGCSSSSSNDDTSAQNATGDADLAKAKSDFWAAFTSGDVDATANARQGLIGVLATHPNDDQLARWIGFSGVLPMATATGPVDPAKAGAMMSEALQYLKTAVDVSSDPHARTYNSDFYAGMIYTRASFTSDQAAAEQARGMLQSVVDGIPAFGYLARADIMADAPKTSPDFALALESYFRFYEQCTGTKIDRDKPDLSAILKRPFADPDTACTNWEHAPHAIQGALVAFGDALVKGGKVDAARPVYAIVKQTEGFDTWKLAQAVDQRLSSDLAGRAASYDTRGDPTTKPHVGLGCFGCHEK